MWFLFHTTNPNPLSERTFTAAVETLAFDLDQLRGAASNNVTASNTPDMDKLLTRHAELQASADKSNGTQATLQAESTSSLAGRCLCQSFLLYKRGHI
jgi:hypothetical protein